MKTSYYSINTLKVMESSKQGVKLVRTISMEIFIEKTVGGNSVWKVTNVEMPGQDI